VNGNKVGWGILAPGGIAGAFVPDLQTVPNAQIIAVASRDKTRAESFAAKHNIAKAYGDYLSLVEDPAVDIVYISSVHTGHYHHAKLALEHGKAVLVEKPFSINARQAGELVALARRKRLFLMEAMWTRTHPLIQEIKQVVARGDIGTVTQLQCSLGPIGLPVGFRGLDPKLAGGSLLECGVYPLNWAYYLLGKPDHFDVSAHFTPKGVDDAMSMLFTYANGVTASLSTSLVEGQSSGLPSSAYIAGTKGWINVPKDIFWANEYHVYRGGDAPPEVRKTDPVGFGYTFEAAEATRCVAAGELESPLMPLEASLDIMAIMDALRERVGLRYAED
jgi:predicted dehydrogenase